MEKPRRESFKQAMTMIGGRITLKIFTIGILTLLLLYPATMIESLIQEREGRQEEAVDEISSKWGTAQTVMGPVISIPYKLPDEKLSYMHFLPDTLHISGKIDPEIRYRGIYEAVLYNAKLELTGSFSYPQPKLLRVARNDIEWSKASISLGTSDIRGIRKTITAQLNGKDMVMKPGLHTHDVMSSGVSAAIILDPQVKKYSFKFVIDLNGSDRIGFVPVGKTTTVALSAKWPNPSFDGSYLPSKRSMRSTDFTAEWRVLDLNRDYPQQWKGDAYKKETQRSSFGVGLFTPVDFYQKSIRTTKYAILFVALTFMAFFISEMVARVRLHFVQYLLIGLAIITFYTLLFSLSEHINFGKAYAMSSVAVIVLVTAYARSILKQTRLAMIVGGILAVVYGYSYWLLQMVDYALVVGSIGIFIVLSVIMYVTRNLDWYSLRASVKEDGELPDRNAAQNP